MQLDETTIKETIDANLRSNETRQISAAVLRSVLKGVVDWIRDSVIEKANIKVNGLLNNEVVPHNLNTERLSVEFFENGTRKMYDIDWEPVSVNAVRVFLPILDNNIESSFSGDVFFMKRV
jgi:hypothetical protein